MLVINKSNPTTKLLVTVTEVNPITSGSTIELFNQYTNVNSSYALPDDSSEYPARFNQFEFSSTTFSGLSEGTYTYTIKDSTSATTETGLLKVVGEVLTLQEEVDADFIYIPSSQADDDFIVYQA